MIWSRFGRNHAVERCLDCWKMLEVLDVSGFLVLAVLFGNVGDAWTVRGW